MVNTDNPLRSFGPKPIRAGSHLPDIVVVLNPSENLALIKECNISNIPTIGIVDTDTDPRIVTYAIPANMEVSRLGRVVSAVSRRSKEEGEADECGLDVGSFFSLGLVHSR